MLSKEEIEEMKDYFNECIIKDTVYEEDLTISFIKIAKEYIDQLESDNYEQNNMINGYIDERQKLIENIEGRIKEYKEKSGGNTYHIQSIINAEIRELDWVLSILKGEKYANKSKWR